MAKIARLRENAKVALPNIAIFWWDYKVINVSTSMMCLATQESKHSIEAGLAVSHGQMVFGGSRHHSFGVSFSKVIVCF